MINPFEALDWSRLISTKPPSIFSMIVRIKWIVSWIILPLRSQHCSGPIRLGRPVCYRSGKIFTKISKSIFNIVKGWNLLIPFPPCLSLCSNFIIPLVKLWNLGPVSSTCYRSLPARAQTCAKASSKLRRADRWSRETCLSRLFLTPAELLPSLFGPHTQPLPSPQSVGSRQDKCRTELSLAPVIQRKVSRSNLETLQMLSFVVWSCLSGDVTLAIYRWVTWLRSSASNSWALFVASQEILFNLALRLD